MPQAKRDGRKEADETRAGCTDGRGAFDEAASERVRRTRNDGILVTRMQPNDFGDWVHCCREMARGQRRVRKSPIAKATSRTTD